MYIVCSTGESLFFDIIPDHNDTLSRLGMRLIFLSR